MPVRGKSGNPARAIKGGYCWWFRLQSLPEGQASAQIFGSQTKKSSMRCRRKAKRKSASCRSPIREPTSTRMNWKGGTKILGSTSPGKSSAREVTWSYYSIPSKFDYWRTKRGKERTRQNKIKQ